LSIARRRGAWSGTDKKNPHLAAIFGSIKVAVGMSAVNARISSSFARWPRKPPSFYQSQTTEQNLGTDLPRRAASSPSPSPPTAPIACGAPTGASPKDGRLTTDRPRGEPREVEECADDLLCAASCLGREWKTWISHRSGIWSSTGK
jgi:hypothetical protein